MKVKSKLKIMKTIKYLIYSSMTILLLTSFISKNTVYNNYGDDEKDSNYVNDPAYDIKPQLEALNSSYKPTSNFRKGHVSKSTLTNYKKQTKTGYIIDFKRAMLVPSPVVYDGKVYISGGFGSKQYYCFDSQTGDLVWAIDLDDDGPSSAAIVDDIIVFNTESCTIFACDAKTGKQLWSYWLGDPLMSMPTIANGIVFTAYPAVYNYPVKSCKTRNNEIIKDNINNTKINVHPSHVLIAIELKTGKILWQKWIDGDVMSAPVADDKFLYVTSFSGTLYKFDQLTGEILEVKSIRATSAPLVNNDKMYVSRRSDDEKDTRVSESISEIVVVGYGVKKSFLSRDAPYLDETKQNSSKLKFDASGMDAGNGFVGGAPGSSGWKKASSLVGQSNVSSLQAYQGSRILHYNGYNYNTMGNQLICSDPKSSEEIWSVKLDGNMIKAGGYMGTPPLNVRDKIIVASYTGDILIYDATTGENIEKYSTGENIRYQPVVDDGWIYITTTTGKMIAIDTQNPELDGWPMWGANAARTNVAGNN